MSELDDDTAAAATPGEEKPKPRRRRRTQATATGSTSRLERRGGKIADTLRELTAWRTADRHAGDRGFVEQVEHDAENIGQAVAGIGEKFKPFGQIIDLVFGAGGWLSILVALAPSIRAGRRDLAARNARRRQERDAEREQAERQAEQAAWEQQQVDQPDSWPEAEQFVRGEQG